MLYSLKAGLIPCSRASSSEMMLRTSRGEIVAQRDGISFREQNYHLKRHLFHREAIAEETWRRFVYDLPRPLTMLVNKRVQRPHPHEITATAVLPTNLAITILHTATHLLQSTPTSPVTPTALVFEQSWCRNSVCGSIFKYVCAKLLLHILHRPLYSTANKTYYSLDVNCDSVTPAPIAEVDETPPVTVLMRLSA